MKNSYLRIFLLALTMLLLDSCKQDKITMPYYNSAEFTPEWITHDDLKTREIHTIDTFTFRDQSNNLISNKDFDGKIMVRFTSQISFLRHAQESVLR